MATNTACDVVVIGAGIVGAMTAYYLQRAGRAVTLLERDTVASGASAGNAGILAFPEITPLAAPGIMRKAPRWLFDPLGPLSLRPAYALKMAPWLWQFWRASQPQAYAHNVRAQTALMRVARSEMEAIVSSAELASHFRQVGTLDLYDSARSLESSLPTWDLKAREGFEFERVDRSAIERLQPGLDARFAHGIFTPAGTQVNDPKRLTEAVVELARQHGAQWRQGQAVAVSPADAGVQIALANGQQIQASAVVVACGAWSKVLAASAGDAVPLDTERGYNTTLPVQSFELQRQLYFNDHGFVVTPLATGIRVGGAVELGGLELPPNFQRSAAMLAKAKSFLPALQTSGGTQWMGFRPSLPDCLPVIGRASASPHVVYAFGHGHLGVTESAGTARLVSDLLTDRKTGIDLTPFSAKRFA